MHEVLFNCLGGLSLPRKSVVRLTDCPDMALAAYCGHKSTTQQQYECLRKILSNAVLESICSCTCI